MICPRCHQREAIDGDGVCQQCWEEQNEELKKEREKDNQTVSIKPIDMIIHCPSCGKQHIDAPQLDKNWTNPSHKSHECQYCGIIWRPCALPTNGVPSINSRGSADTWPIIEQE